MTLVRRVVIAAEVELVKKSEVRLWVETPVAQGLEPVRIIAL